MTETIYYLKLSYFSVRLIWQVLILLSYHDDFVIHYTVKLLITIYRKIEIFKLVANLLLLTKLSCV